MEGLLASVILWQQILQTASTPRERMRAVVERSARRHARQRAVLVPQIKKFVPTVVQEPAPETVLVFAPHPDDEVLCCSRTIQGLREGGTEVKVIYITDGDALETEDWHKSRAYGKERRKEALQASKALGLRRKDAIFLGFPDGMLDSLAETIPIRSPFTHQTESSRGHSFPRSKYSRGVLRNNVEQLLRRYQPMAVYLPGQSDTHPDHQTTGEVVTEALREINRPTQLYSYVVHSLKNNTQKTDLNPEKLRLIQLYQSQMHDPSSQWYLERFAWIPEVFEVSQLMRLSRVSSSTSGPMPAKR